MEYIIPGVCLQVCKWQKLWNVARKFLFPEVKVICKKLTSKMEIITLGPSLPLSWVNLTLMALNDHFFDSAHCLLKVYLYVFPELEPLFP